MISQRTTLPQRLSFAESLEPQVRAGKLTMTAAQEKAALNAEAEEMVRTVARYAFSQNDMHRGAIDVLGSIVEGTKLGAEGTAWLGEEMLKDGRTATLAEHLYDRLRGEL